MSDELWSKAAHVPKGVIWLRNKTMPELETLMVSVQPEGIAYTGGGVVQVILFKERERFHTLQWSKDRTKWAACTVKGGCK